MNEPKPEDVMRALAWYEVVGKNIGSVTVPYDAIQAIANLLREKDAEIEMLKHSKGVAQVNIVNEIANCMQIKEFNSNEIATGYAWAINDLLKLLLELKKKVMGGTENG